MGRIKITLFSSPLKEILNRTRGVHDWVTVKIMILLVELSSQNTLQSGMWYEYGPFQEMRHKDSNKGRGQGTD